MTMKRRKMNKNNSHSNHWRTGKRGGGGGGVFAYRSGQATIWIPKDIKKLYVKYS